ncbi:unnamed protein product, partial [Iphiclides podalirius]
MSRPAAEMHAGERSVNLRKPRRGGAVGGRKRGYRIAARVSFPRRRLWERAADDPTGEGEGGSPFAFDYDKTRTGNCDCSGCCGLMEWAKRTRRYVKFDRLRAALTMNAEAPLCLTQYSGRHAPTVQRRRRAAFDTHPPTGESGVDP